MPNMTNVVKVHVRSSASRTNMIKTDDDLCMSPALEYD